MDNETDCTGSEGIVVPESALLRRLRPNKYGCVPGLDDSELADPDELERGVLEQEFAPLLALPVKASKGCIRLEIDESGGVDWGAFGTVDFDRYSGGFDKARYKADKLREQLHDLLIMFSIVSDRIRAGAKYLVLRYVRKDILGLEYIANDDMRALARLYLRARQLQKEIAELRQASKRRGLRRAEASCGSG